MSVYLLFNEETGAVKIGHSENVQVRKHQLQIGSSENLRLIRVLEGNKATERWFHRRFERHHIRGEWFQLADEMLTIRPPDILEKQEPAAQKTEFASMAARLVNARKLGLLKDNEVKNLLREFRRAITMLEGTLPPEENQIPQLEPDRQLVMPGFERLQERYLITEDGEQVAIRVQDMTSAQRREKAAELRAMGDGCYQHADELERFDRYLVAA